MGSRYKDLIKERARAQRKQALARYYQLNSIFGNTWAIFFPIIGGRKTGKSYAATDFVCNQKRKKGDKVKAYWMRISETSVKALLCDKANKLVDPDLKRKYNLNLSTKGMTVFNSGKTFIEVVALSQMGKLKGVNFFDKDYRGDYIIVLDEFQLEQGEKRTSFDILYNFIGMCENLVRTTKSNIKVILLGNTLEEASTILKAFNFIPEKFGRFYLRSKRCVIDNIEPTEEYLADREGSIADLLGGDKMSNYCNELLKDYRLIDKSRRYKATAIIKFSKDSATWYTVWDNKIIASYKGEKLPDILIYPMRPYLDSTYTRERRLDVLDKYDARFYRFNSLITKAYFEGDLKKIRKE